MTAAITPLRYSSDTMQTSMPKPAMKAFAAKNDSVQFAGMPTATPKANFFLFTWVHTLIASAGHLLAAAGGFLAAIPGHIAHAGRYMGHLLHIL